MRGPERWRRLRAWLGGWFWLPCPRCGNYFAGYEANPLGISVDVEYDDHGRMLPASGRIICPDCEQKEK